MQQIQLKFIALRFFQKPLTFLNIILFQPLNLKKNDIFH